MTNESVQLLFQWTDTLPLRDLLGQNVSLSRFTACDKPNATAGRVRQVAGNPELKLPSAICARALEYRRES